MSRNAPVLRTPISVLSQDYRLFTAILAKRLEIILPEIIHLDQMGFIKHRQTQDNIRRTLHVMQHIIKNQIETVVVGIDAEKAFHSIGWDFLYRVLERFHFHKTFIKVIQALYNKPTARIRINGSLSKFITLRMRLSSGLLSEFSSFHHFLGTPEQWDKTK